MNQLRPQTYIYLAIICAMLAACGKKVSRPLPPHPDSLITVDVMALILTDMHLAEVIAGTKITTEDTVAMYRKGMYEAVYQKFKLGEQTFKANFDYYKQMPLLMDSVYAQVITNLMHLEEHSSVKFNFLK
jgi:hypothetical protein